MVNKQIFEWEVFEPKSRKVESYGQQKQEVGSIKRGVTTNKMPSKPNIETYSSKYQQGLSLHKPGVNSQTKDYYPFKK